MVKKALKLLLSTQAKATCWFLGIYALTMAIVLIVFSYVKIDDTSWIRETIIYAPKIYLLVMGIVYPLVATKLYVSRGLTRKQFFWAYTGAISIVSLFLLIPILASIIYFENISLLSAITHYLHMPLYFLIGWSSVVGFQFLKWHMAIFGVLGAVVMFHAITTVPGLLALSELAVLGSVILLLAAVLLILPRIISQIPLKV
ncbi:hypothetical protein [Bacillus sp. OK048]|uniref:hypothetical protein n=1 Tax=Bacillus sp. OK048 TaxID=1882761 RepID=UPI00088431D1|nr:hypothetical protein [Bacillus sp. OK048]SDN72170.1 hypothetical protein SAMN05443253_11758 [Bacillus sp. OK048]